ncbi:MAG: WD40/YVTN/BNR-like repeat-containing protein, partial [Persicimonas sp.]
MIREQALVYRHHLIAVVLALGVLAGCSEEQTTIDLRSVPLPAGGSVHAVAVLDGPDRLDVVAPSAMGLFVHRNDTGAWQRLDPDWPTSLPERHSAPLRALGGTAASLNLPRSQVFTAHEGRLWMVVGMPGPDGPRLLMSEDVGRSWTVVGLPEVDDSEAGDPAADKPSTARLSGGQQAHAAVRLLNLGDEGLFLVNGTHLWRLSASEDQPLDDTPWEAVSLEGIDWERQVGETGLPTILRHYLPATDVRPYELLTVLRDRLSVYRRTNPDEPWVETATLGAADRQLLGVPDTDAVLMLTPVGLRVSTDRGENWDYLNPPEIPRDGPEGVAVEVLPATDQAPVTILLSLDNGTIYRTTDLGREWVEVRPPDDDRRLVTDFVYSPRRDRVWAASNGAGILRSLDRGETWHSINDELRATRPLDIDIDDNGGVLLGSDAGLFRMIGVPGRGHWQMLQDRSTSALYLEPNSGTLISGTTNGALVRLEPDGKSSAAEAVPLERGDEIVYQPMRFRGQDLPPRTIATIEARPDSQQIFAWSIQEGPLTSVDGGVSWTRLALNPAFQSALEGSYLSSFTTDYGERMYLITHSLDGASPTQLWRSYNNGETWHAVSSFPQSRRRDNIFIDRSAEEPPEVLFMAHG